MKTEFKLAIRKLEGILQMIQIGNVEGFEKCNMKATEQKLMEAIKLLKRSAGQ